jgi:hypothetical protein
MTPARRLFALVLLGVAVLVLALLVIIRNRSVDDEMLAIIGLLGGVAIIVTSLPTGGEP